MGAGDGGAKRVPHLQLVAQGVVHGGGDTVAAGVHVAHHPVRQEQHRRPGLPRPQRRADVRVEAAEHDAPP